MSEGVPPITRALDLDLLAVDEQVPGRTAPCPCRAPRRSRAVHAGRRLGVAHVLAHLGEHTAHRHLGDGLL